MSDNSIVVIIERPDGDFELWRRDVDFRSDDHDYRGSFIGIQDTIREATKLASQQGTEYGYDVEWREHDGEVCPNCAVLSHVVLCSYHSSLGKHLETYCYCDDHGCE